MADSDLPDDPTVRTPGPHDEPASPDGPGNRPDDGPEDPAPPSASSPSPGAPAVSASSNPLLGWFAAVQGLSEAALASFTAAPVLQASQLGQAQWQAMLDAMAMMAKLPLTNLEQSARELARLREAVGVMQLQLDGFDQQLAALEAVVQPLRDWARAWSPGA